MINGLLYETHKFTQLDEHSVGGLLFPSWLEDNDRAVANLDRVLDENPLYCYFNTPHYHDFLVFFSRGKEKGLHLLEEKLQKFYGTGVIIAAGARPPPCLRLAAAARFALQYSAPRRERGSST